MRLGYEKARRRDKERENRCDPIRDFVPLERRKGRKRKIRAESYVERGLIVEGKGFKAVAVWRKVKRGKWQCVEAGELIAWMKGLLGESAAKALAQRPDWKWRWGPLVVVRR